MAYSTDRTSPQIYARTAGALYLIVIVFGIGAELFIRANILAAGDASTTAANILRSGSLFRLGFAGDSIVFLADVAIAVLLFFLLAPVNKTLALIAAGFRLTQTAVLASNLLNHHAALELLDSPAYASAFSPEQLQALSLHALEMHGYGYDLALLFFGLSCLVLGWLIARSGYLPRPLGLLVFLAGIAYLIGSYTLFLFPDFRSNIEPIYIVPLISEIALCLWLLIRGVNVERWRSHVEATG